MIHKIVGAIGESELIVSARGSIYHLDIAPEHLAPVVILVGDPGRVSQVSKHFDRITHTAQHREFITHTGYIGSKHLSVISTGIGPDNIDIVLNELDALVNIDLKTRTVKETKTSRSLIRLGTCGALQNGIPVDSLIASTHGIGLDNLMQYYQTTNTQEELVILEKFNQHTGLNRNHIFPYITQGSITLLKHFAKDFTQGITVTCPGFYGPQGRILRAPVALPHLQDALASFECSGARIANFDMETAAIYGLGRLLGHKCVSISTVVANRAGKTFSKDPGKAVDGMIKKCLEVIMRI